MNTAFHHGLNIPIIGPRSCGHSNQDWMYTEIQSSPQIPSFSGLAKNRRYWKTAVKGVIYNQEKTYSGLENQLRYWGGGGQRRCAIGGGGGGDNTAVLRFGVL